MGPPPRMQTPTPCGGPTQAPNAHQYTIGGTGKAEQLPQSRGDSGGLLNQGRAIVTSRRPVEETTFEQDQGPRDAVAASLGTLQTSENTKWFQHKKPEKCVFAPQFAP